MNIDFQALKAVFLSNLDSLYKFNFFLDNPLFWLAILISYLILRRSWEVKKTLTFIFIVAVILLLSTKLEERFASFMTSSGELFEPGIVRLVSLVIIAILFLVFTFLG
ncbi:MAG: hypothetical protein A3K83_07005 [Omnitrophica WOR_2 bacterium RBG_13_44_8b]|nr:MAG: hypothetical protein A3K83_07005 [Omnitrophica WOR_2 bacterium RBG_13_44_8b]